ncbi:Putative odorant receptor 94b [Trachymyrmex zeteki]|uniref:Odorant receptor n=1 Tax=Mycetomoellerius zeteki TaxID=64791 RepID=A0A151X987_9HYME|nr:Putative odorant receptor 94b [Trachymyrmex zeteki]
MNEAKRIACAFMFISQISGFLVLIGPLMTQNERQLPMKMYVPYSMVELLPYLLTYLEQVAVVFYGVSLNVALDSLVYGFIIHTCGQIELMCYRLSETFRFLQENNKEKEHDVIEKFAIAECVKHHVSVCNIMHRIQSLFMWIITILFFFSLITLCSSVYQMSNKMFFSVEFFGFLVYLGAMLFQVFSYCWYAIVILIYEFTISEVIELVRTHDDIEGITEGLFLALTYVALCFKYGNFLVRKNEVSMLLDCFRRETCQPRNSEERMILIKYDRKVKWCVRTFMSISQATCIALILAPIVGPQNTDRPLPFKTYLPYSISGLYPYLATYLQHVGAIFYGVLLNVSFDSLVYGFTLHVCGQIELLCYRLSKIYKDHPEQYQIDTDKGTMISECVRHQLYKRLLSVGFLSLTLYLSCMLFQVFFYCWYGNELQLKSKGIGDAIYSSNWTTATTRDRRSLLFVMATSQKGLKLSYYGIFNLALDTFTWVNL